MAEGIIRTVDECGPALERMGASEGVTHLARSLHLGAWFEVDKSGNLLISRRGGRQGCKLGPMVFNIGYAFANVTPFPELDKENRKVKLTLFVDPGKRVYVRRVNFIGNSKTRDEVLRREMRQFEGGWFSQALVDRSRLRLQRLSFVEDVNIETPQVPGTDDQVDVNVTINERTAGSFTFGLGFSQVTGILGSVSVSQENFLGTGRQLGFSLNNSRFFKRFDLALA